ncbi:MAG: FAD-binding protein, partial [bacterium]|nr:FAD-binding protein [bacterium]
MNITEELQKHLGKPVIEDELMAKHTNYRIGGPAKWFVEIKTVEEIQNVLAFTNKEKIRTFVFGGGSNMLVNDEGFDGVAIKIAMRSYEIKGTMVKAEAGVLSSALARATANAGLEGFTWGISLPGTIGGAVRGNAGCFGGETRDQLVSAEVLRDGEVISLTNAQLQFGYRESSIKHSDDIVLSATFEFKEGDTAELKAELDDKLMKRKTTQ